jgi:hypothetical protein
MAKKNKNLGYEIEKNQFFLNPITLQLEQNITKSNVCPTKFFFENNQIKNTKIDCNKNSNEDIHKYMLYPHTIISYFEILNLYNINSFDDLYNIIKNIIEENNNFIFIHRIINIWIKNNFDDLKNKNKILIKLYIYIFEHFYPNNEISEKMLQKYINDWFTNNKSNNFYLNLGEEILKKSNLI